MKTKNQNQTLPHIVIVGAGFGGLRAARRLANAPVRVTLVDRNNYHLFQPLLYQVATAGISPDEIAYPVRSILRRQKNVTFHMAEVTGVNLEQKRLHTSGGELAYDTLILAVGGVTHTFGLESVARHSFGLKELQDANRIRNHLLRMFERASQETDPAVRRSLLTFVVVGGGPTGVESAGAISELIRLMLSKDFPGQDFSEARVLLLEATQRLLPHLPADLGEQTEHALQAKRVEVRYNTVVTNYDGRRVSLQDGSQIAAQTLIWAAGVRAAGLADELGAEQASQGRVRVLPTLQLPSHPDVFVIGDAAYLEDEHQKPLPMVAPVAIQQADTAVKNIQQILSGKPLVEFHYHNPGSMATIGRNQAVAQLGRLKFRGFIAWVIWLVVHLMQLVGFRNRLLVLINWAWDYFLYDRAVRLIDAERPSRVGKSAAQLR